ncbi:MAG: methyltransferase [Fibrobacter sp.]|nr:methyltransferase [Fibrobacter sp.]
MQHSSQLPYNPESGPVNNRFPSELLLQSYAPITPVPCCESICAHIAPDFFTLWEEYEKEAGCETGIPYWAAVWPGAKSLARYLLSNRELVCGKKVLDFGSGSGVVSIASCQSGALDVVANDIDPIARFVASQNFSENNVSVRMTSDNMLTSTTDEHFDLVLVCDMFYERSTAKPLHAFLESCINKGTRVIIADGTRPFTPRECLLSLYSEVIPVNHALEGMRERTVTVFEMKK